MVFVGRHSRSRLCSATVDAGVHRVDDKDIGTVVAYQLSPLCIHTHSGTQDGLRRLAMLFFEMSYKSP